MLFGPYNLRMHLPRLIQHPVFQIRWIRDWRHFRQAKCLSRGCHAYDERLVTNVLELGAKNVPWLDLLDPWLDPMKKQICRGSSVWSMRLEASLMHVDSWLIAMYILIYIIYIHNTWLLIHVFIVIICIYTVSGVPEPCNWETLIINKHHFLKGPLLTFIIHSYSIWARTQYIVFAWYSVCWQMWNF